MHRSPCLRMESSPQFIETLPRRGYRFIAPVTGIEGTTRGTGTGVSAAVPSRSWKIVTTVAVVVLAAGIAGGLLWRAMNWKFMSGWHVSIAAEAIAAALFAQCGYDVSVQYGANQPESDLMIAKGKKMLKVSVKGSQDGAWGLCQSHLKNADYHAAIKIWLERHKPRTVLCLVQFRDIDIAQMPHVYLATPDEVASQLKATAKGRGGTMLYERHEWGARAHGAGTVEQIPCTWRFSSDRVDQLSQTV